MTEFMPIIPTCYECKTASPKPHWRKRKNIAANLTEYYCSRDCLRATPRSASLDRQQYLLLGFRGDSYD